MLHTYLFVFGLNIPTVVVSQDDMSDASMDDKVTCETVHDIGDAESFVYLTCIYVQMSLEVVSI